MKKAIVILAAVVALAGCEEKKAESSAAAGIEFQVDKLFTHDGCTVYRFVDLGLRYFARCDGAASSGFEWTESCGKNCTRPVQVPTAIQRAKEAA